MFNWGLIWRFNEVSFEFSTKFRQMFQFCLNEPKWDILLTFYARPKKKIVINLLFSALILGKFIWGFKGLKVGVSGKFP
jgi:hypothetical protein